MYRNLRRLAIVALLWGSARAAERDFVRTFPVQPDCTVEIDTYRGPIEIKESDLPQVRVAVHLEIGADGASEAERVLRGFHLTFKDSNRVVSVVARHPAETGIRFIWEDRHQIEPTFRVTVPRQCNLTLKTGTGRIVVGDVSGRIRARVESGFVFLRHVGGTVDATTEEGDVVVSQCEGSFFARVLHGKIRAGVIDGACDLRNSSGDIDVMEANGNIRAHAVAGSVRVGVGRRFGGTANLSTSGGDVVLQVDPGANCNIDARTSLFGHVECRLAAAIESGRIGGRKLVARLNAGGPKFTLYSSGGDIRLEPGAPPFD